MVSSWCYTTSALRGKVPVPIARSAKSAWYVVGMVIGADGALGKRSSVGSLDRFRVLDQGLLGSWGWVLRRNHGVILMRSLTLMAAVLVSWLGLERFGIGYGGWFGGGLQGFGRGFGFEISISHMVLINSSREMVGLFKGFRPGSTHCIADSLRESAGVLHNCFGGGGDLVRA